LGVGYVTNWYQRLSSTLDLYGPRTSVNFGKITITYFGLIEFGGKRWRTREKSPKFMENFEI
jgi:hypothetical protein